MAFYFGVIKEPRGLIRLLQLIFAIFAFATACNGGSNLTLKIPGNNNAVKASWSYPYDLRDSTIDTDCNNTQSALSTSNSIKPSAQFFVFTGVTSMILALVFLVIYIILDRVYRFNLNVATVDFVLIILWTIFWFAGSCAWAQGVSDLRKQTSSDFVQTLVSCNGTLSVYEIGTYANVIVSAIFGFLNVVLWLGSSWFIYKETKFYKSRTAQQDPQQYPPQSNFANISDPYSKQQPRVPGTFQ